ncbi:MAG: VanW family protein [Cellulomonadaceae bacterium]
MTTESTDVGPDGDAPLLEDFDGGTERRSRVPRTLLWVGLSLVVLGGAYVAAQWAVADTVADRTTVAGVAIGGMSQTEAVRALDDGLAAQVVAPVEVTAGERTATLDPVAAGLTLDAEATVADLTGFSLSPVHLWNTWFGGGEVDPVVSVDRAELDAQLAALAQSVAVAPENGAIVLTEGRANAVAPVTGQEIDPEASAQAVADGWLRTSGPIALPVTEVAPQVDQAATDAALAQASTLVSAPVAVSVAGQVAEVPVDVLSAVSSFVAEDDGLALTIDADALRAAVIDRTTNLEVAPEDAHFEFQDGTPVVVGGRTGASLPAAELAAAVQTAALSGENRTADVELAPQEAERSAEKLQSLGVQEVVSEFSTPLGASNAARVHNLQLGAERVTGQLILPGETWSLTEALSPITAEGGYRSAGIVNNGVLTEGVGGGLSQMATTTYNAGFFAGYDDTEHRPHSYYFSRYPEGREATMFVGSLDMRFTNDTPYGALMQAWVADGQVTVRIWSTQYYEVRTSTSARSGVVQPTTEHRSGAGCISQSAGSPGFTVTVARTVLHDGEAVKDESQSWTYRPQNAIVCDRSETPVAPAD